jgi:hypothetical protein
VTLSRVNVEDVEDLIQRVRKHYLDQFRKFVAAQHETTKTGSPELKLQLKGPTSLYRDMYCIDFVKNPDKPALLELQPARYLGFAPVTWTFGRMEAQIVGLRWNEVHIAHDKPDLQPACLLDWFDTWFDPDDKRHDATTELSGIIHSLAIEGRTISVDFGSAPVDAFWSLLEVLEKADVTSVRINDQES